MKEVGRRFDKNKEGREQRLLGLSSVEKQELYLSVTFVRFTSFNS